MIKQLTKAEEQIMQILWDLNTASIKQIIEKIENPKPAYNTVSTIIRILETKKFVGHSTRGRGYIYHPIIDKKKYTKQSLQKLMDGYFKGSFSSLVSFFVKENNIDIAELETILEEINSKNKQS